MSSQTSTPSPSVSIEKFNGKSNFSLWRIKIQALLKQQGIWAPLAGPKPVDMTDAKYNSQDEKAHSTILLSLSDEVLYEVGGEGNGLRPPHIEKMFDPVLAFPELRHQASGTSESQPVSLSATGQDREKFDLTSVLDSKVSNTSMRMVYSVSKGALVVDGSNERPIVGASRDLLAVVHGSFLSSRTISQEYVVFMMKHKSEAFEKFKHWKILIENQNQEDQASQYWIRFLNFVQRGSPATAIDCKTPIEVCEGKLDSRGEKGIFMGYSEGVKGYRIWSPSERRVIFSQDVTFDDDYLFRVKQDPIESKLQDGVSRKVAEEVESLEPATYREAITSKDSDMWIAAMGEEIESLKANYGQEEKHVKIDPILTYLSRKTRVKKLKFDFAWAGHILPLSHYSFRHLTDLHLIRCGFHLPPTFNGFRSLTSLYLEEVIISTRTLQHLFSNCPLLKTVILDIRNPCISGSIGGPTSSAIFECLPVIETFSISFHLIRAFGAIDKVPRELSITLIHLKYLRLDGVYFNNKTHLSILALLIISSLNLEKLKVFDNSKFEISKRYCFRVEDYSDIMLERLNELEITSFINAKNQLDFVRLILARSLVLKKVRIFPHSKISMKEKSKIKLQILRDSVIYPCASPEGEQQTNPPGLRDNSTFVVDLEEFLREKHSGNTTPISWQISVKDQDRRGMNTRTRQEGKVPCLKDSEAEDGAHPCTSITVRKAQGIRKVTLKAKIVREGLEAKITKISKSQWFEMSIFPTWVCADTDPFRRSDPSAVSDDQKHECQVM
ncbi:F-box/FBD/LRR-repeat protein-like protein [Tanacetum coccineum]|uniref:F-box/FBD/LRR-repeat protein-like protein n=1 Tax=Tanacetum coccineum TaxID=301880 RepID=A0ABQ5GHD4_9ASTR